MIPGVSGSLLSHEVIAQIVPTAFQGLLDEAGREPARHRLRTWHLTLRGQLGPALAVRAIFERRFGADRVEAGNEFVSIANGLATIGLREDVDSWVVAPRSEAAPARRAAR